MQKPFVGGSVHFSGAQIWSGENSASRDWSFGAQVVAAGQLGGGGVELGCALEESPGGVNSSPAALTGGPSYLGLVCPRADAGRVAVHAETLSLPGSGPPDLDSLA